MLRLKIEGNPSEINDFLKYLGIDYRVRDINSIVDFADFSVTFCTVTKSEKRG